MSELNRVHPFSEFSGSLPGKVMLLGEYAALRELPSIVASLTPRFRWETSLSSRQQGISAADLHPQSPAGILLRSGLEQMGPDALELGAFGTFIDPWKGAGGFGASSAQFAWIYDRFAAELGWSRDSLSVWKKFRECMDTVLDPGGILPSGVDLLGQWEGGVIWAEPIRGKVLQISSELDWSRLMIFSATHQKDRKVRTHENLRSLAERGFFDPRKPTWFDSAGRLLEKTWEAIRVGDSLGFGSTLKAYAEHVAEVGLELERAREDRLSCLEVPGVVAAKGTGALMADAFIVWVDSETPDFSREAVLDWARKRDLVCVSPGYSGHEAGMVS